MVLGYSLLRAYVAEHIQLLLVFSTHTFFLSGCVVETRVFCGTVLASTRVFPQPARAAGRPWTPLLLQPEHRARSSLILPAYTTGPEFPWKGIWKRRKRCFTKTG